MSDANDWPALRDVILVSATAGCRESTLIQQSVQKLNPQEAWIVEGGAAVLRTTKGDANLYIGDGNN